ncbi:MAG TPA: STAS domain-containing protein [Solirubrobacteraceae bacterium]|nr:STAS domain-containing protein [Solirubrobacteraceae bacterium]
MTQSNAATTDPVPTVAPAGALDLASSRGLQTRLAELAGEHGHYAILDLSRVSFIDSVGLGVVLKAANRFHRQSKRLFIVAPEGPVHRILDFAGVTDRLSVVDTVDEARAVIRHG